MIRTKLLDNIRVRDILLIFVLILILLISPYLKDISISIPSFNIPTVPSANDNYNEPQANTPVDEPQGGYVPDTSTGKGLCEQGCNDFCNANPNTPSIPWHEITPPGSTKNCKTILEEELGVADLSTCKECKCMCSTG
ncbi:MAG: hypothetical protein KAT94_03505 [Candidatus Aenigmarchaeota archaeon]|nr:hypothetical protein [Candidatus Aenigmarchaeota archaeon]